MYSKQTMHNVHWTLYLLKSLNAPIRIVTKQTKICSFSKLSKQRHWGRWWQWWWKNWHSWNYHWSGISHPGLRHFPIWRHLCALCLKKFSPLNHIKTATLKHHGTDFCSSQRHSTSDHANWKNSLTFMMKLNKILSLTPRQSRPVTER